MSNFKVGDKVKVVSTRGIGVGPKDGYKDKKCTIIDNEGYSNGENRWVVSFGDKLLDNYCGEEGTCSWVFFDEELAKAVKNTALARKMYPDGEEKGEWLHV